MVAAVRQQHCQQEYRRPVRKIRSLCPGTIDVNSIRRAAVCLYMHQMCMGEKRSEACTQHFILILLYIPSPILFVSFSPFDMMSMTLFGGIYYVKLQDYTDAHSMGLPAHRSKIFMGLPAHRSKILLTLYWCTRVRDS